MIHDAGAKFSLAEAHGIMTGMLCVDQSIGFEQWQHEIQLSALCDQNFAELVANCLARLFDETRDSFTDTGFEFEPCLPDDEIPCKDRTLALSEWCQGFLHGLGHANVKNQWPGQCKEIIGDFIAISDVDLEEEEEDDDEESLVELIEYVRVGVELIRIELLPMAIPKTLH